MTNGQHLSEYEYQQGRDKKPLSLDAGDSCNGRWSDGKTAAAHSVEIELQNTALLFRRDDENSLSHTNHIHEWPYASIHSPSPISPNDEHVLITSTDYPGERLFIDTPDFAAKILSRAPNVSRRSHQWALLKWPLGMAVALVFFWALTYFDVISPANSLAKLMPDDARTTIGTGLIKTIRQDSKVCQTPAGNAALNKLLYRLTPALPKALDYKVQVADINYVNAFAAPGDQIIVSGKLIQQAKSADEVAGVIAHELGHSIERHPEANLIRALGLLTMVQLLTAGEAGAFGDIAFMLVQSGYSRSAEAQADKHAAKILNMVDIDSRPLALFFERLINKAKDKSKDENPSEDNADKTSDTSSDNAMTRETDADDDASETSDYTGWISTHPPTKNRINYFNKSKINTAPAILTPTEWAALQAICGKPKENDKSAKQAGDSKPAARKGGSGK
ncbi:MAG: metalloendopeptidase [Rhodomicrobium sp.]|nr:MAG: metalloendopeptidase [Rhodomicrobium sp.]